MRVVFIVAVLLLASAFQLRAQDPLDVAKNLYASAAYEEALSALNGFGGSTLAPGSARQIDEYRAFCLYALGRTREAESVAESIIRKVPLAQLEAVDASPRIQTMFTDVRRRLLPSLVREHFLAARSAIDQKNFSSAEPRLNEARLMIAEARRIGVKDDGLEDLGILIDGFLTLIHSAVDQQTSPPAAPPSPVTAAAASSSPAAPKAPAGGTPVYYSIADEGVSPPVAIEQRMPVMTPQMLTIARATGATGVLEVLIDETGHVADATIRQSFNPTFDTLVVRAARRWTYRPAMKEGVPVRFVKTIALVQ